MTEPIDPETVLSEPGGGATSDGDEAFCSHCGKSYPLELDVCPIDGARLAKLKARPDSLLGRVFEGRYEVRMTLGQGGMGTVYRGWQLSVDREVAIKVIHPKLATDRTAVKRFLREARLSSRLSQPSIVNVYDFGQTDDGILYIVMELLRGHALSRELEAQQPMLLKRVVTIALQLCDALDAAHGQGIIHRDLKPGNIVILDEPPGRDLIKVLDFGLAKTLTTDTSTQVTNTNAILGTPLYMSPEQIECKPSDQRADLYALGCMLYQMVTGRPPFVGDSVSAVLAHHISDAADPLPIGVPPGLVSVITRLMEKDPNKRIAAAAAVRAALLTVLEAGFSTNELSDTTPDVDPAEPASVVMTPMTPSMLRSSPIALAVTDPAGSRLAAPMVDSTPSIELAPPRRSRKLVVVAVVAVVGLAGGVGFVMTRNSLSPKAGPADAMASRAPDATTAAPPDAAIELVDAYVAVQVVDAPPDAGVKRKLPRKQIDAGDDPGFIMPKP
jgi:serine/threonine-protein kinase